MIASFHSSMSALTIAIEATGVLVILGGFAFSTWRWLRSIRSVDAHSAYVSYRRSSVRGLILGLEFFVAADIIRTITIDYTIDGLQMLGMIVLIRSFLVFALHLEIEGRLPWQRELPEGENAPEGEIGIPDKQ